jgi:hypothetical protein
MPAIALLSGIPTRVLRVRRGPQRPVRPVQVWAARLPPLQYRELVAQDQDLRAPPCPLTLG